MKGVTIRSFIIHISSDARIYMILKVSYQLKGEHTMEKNKQRLRFIIELLLITITVFSSCVVRNVIHHTYNA